MPVSYKTVSVDGLTLFREAGDPARPTVLLLHGFPTASHMFRDLIPQLAEQYHLIAPGRNDPFFLPAGAEAYRRDLPSADIRFVDSGHFALETHAVEIDGAMRDFLSTHLG
jgi:pimeloyl-ACP methyl ester carboxylesterase